MAFLLGTSVLAVATGAYMYFTKKGSKDDEKIDNNLSQDIKKFDPKSLKKPPPILKKRSLEPTLISELRRKLKKRREFTAEKIDFSDGKSDQE